MGRVAASGSFFSHRLGELRLADIDVLARLDIGHEVRNCRVQPAGDRIFEQRRDITQRGFGLYQRRAERRGRLQPLDTDARELVATLVGVRALTDSNRMSSTLMLQ